jgi:hypothetical protein
VGVSSGLNGRDVTDLACIGNLNYLYCIPSEAWASTGHERLSPPIPLLFSVIRGLNIDVNVKLRQEGWTDFCQLPIIW